MSCIAPADKGQTSTADALRLAAFACLLALAPAMVVAHRSSILTVTLAACLAGAAATLDGQAAALGRELRQAVSGPTGAAALAFLLFGLLSIAWSPRPAASLGALGEFVLPIAACLVLAATLPGRLPRAAPILVAASLALAAALLIGDLASGLAARRWAGLRAQSFVLNRPALTLLVLLPAALWLLREARRPGLAALLAALVAAAILRSDSGAAKLGLATGAAAGLLAWLSGRAALALAGFGILLALALAPVTGELADRFLPDSLTRALAGAHARDRVDIWMAFGAALRDAPILGQGFGAAARLDSAPVAATVAADHGTLLAVGHPHSAPLQIWVEGGAIGAALAAAVAALALGGLASWRAPDRAFVLALVAAACADMMVGQGAWQGWWPAAIGTALVLVRHGFTERERADGRA